MTLAETHPALMALGWGTVGWSELPVTLAQMTISSALPGVVGGWFGGVHSTRRQGPPRSSNPRGKAGPGPCLGSGSSVLPRSLFSWLAAESSQHPVQLLVAFPGVN